MSIFKEKIIAGNWKMNGSLLLNKAWVTEVKNKVQKKSPCNVKILIFPPAIYLSQIESLTIGSRLECGAQDVSTEVSGNRTGEISVAMLQEFNVRYSLVGHSERRTHHFESSANVAQKAQQLLKSQITPIICIGESAQEKSMQRTEQALREQLLPVIELLGTRLSQTIFAYEPIWAIGSGLSANPDDVNQVHQFIRRMLNQNIQTGVAPKMLYGGSINADNALDYLRQPEIDGVLVGGASLNPASFLKIIEAADLLTQSA